MTSQNLGDATLTLRADTRNLDRGIASAEQKAQRFATNTRSAAMAIAGMTAPLVAISAIGVKTFAGFEAQMSRVRGITGASAEQFKVMEDTAREMGRTTVFTATQSADALVFLGMAGLSAQDSVTALPHLLNLAAAGALELGTAADIATNIMTPFGMAAEEAGRVADVLAAAATSANTNVEQMGVAMSYAAPLAKTAGVSFEETAAAIAIMGNSGIQATRAGTAMRGGLTRLLSPTKEAAALLDQLSISTKNADGSLRPMPELFRDLAAAELTAEERITIFGLRAMPGMNAVLDAAADDSFPAFIKAMEDSGGTAERLAATNLDNLQGSFTLLKSGAEGAALALGEAMEPNIRKMADALTRLIPNVTKWIDDNPRLAAGLAAAGTAVAVLAVAAIGLSLILPGLIVMFGGLSVAATAFGVALQFALGPIGLVVLASAAVVAGLLILSNHFKQTGEVTEATRKTMSQAELALLDMKDAGIQLSDMAENRLNRALSGTRDGLRDTRIEAVAYTASLKSMTAAQLEQARATAVQAILDLGKQRTIAQEELDELVEALARVDAQIADSTAESNYAIAQAEIARVVREVTQAQKDNSLSISEQNRMIAQLTDWIIVARDAASHLGEQYTVTEGAQRVLSAGSEDLGLIIERVASAANDATESTSDLGDAAGETAEDIAALKEVFADAERILADYKDEQRAVRDMEKLLAGATNEVEEATIRRSLAAHEAERATVDLRAAEYNLNAVMRDATTTEEEAAEALAAFEQAKRDNQTASDALAGAEKELAAAEREVAREAEKLITLQARLAEVMRDVARDVSLAQQALAFQRGEIRQNATAAETLAEITEINAQASRAYQEALAAQQAASEDATTSAEELAEIEADLRESGEFLIQSTNLLADAERELGEASDNLAAAQAEVAAATDRVTAAEIANNNAAAALASAEYNLSAARSAHAANMTSLSAAEDNLASARSYHTSVLRSLAQAERSLQSARGGYESAVQNLADAEANLEKVRSSSSGSGGGSSGSSRSESGLAAAREASREANEALREAESALKDARKEHDDTIKALTEAEEGLEAARIANGDAIAALPIAEERLRKVRDGLADGTTHLIDEETELTEIRDDLGVYNDNLTEAENTLDNARWENRLATMRVTGAEANLEAVRGRHETASRAVTRAEGRLTDARERHEAATNATTRAEGRLTNARERLSGVNRRIQAEEELQAALRNTTNDVDEARLQLAIQSGEITELEAAQARLGIANSKLAAIQVEYTDALRDANVIDRSSTASAERKAKAQDRLQKAGRALVDIMRTISQAGRVTGEMNLGGTDSIAEHESALQDLKTAMSDLGEASTEGERADALMRIIANYDELSDSVLHQAIAVGRGGEAERDYTAILTSAKDMLSDAGIETDQLNDLRAEQRNATNAVASAEAALTETQRSAAATARNLQSATNNLEQAKIRAETAANSLRVAEERLKVATDSARTASKLLTEAENGLATAQDQARTASELLTNAENGLTDAQNNVRASAINLHLATNTLIMALEAEDLAADNLKLAVDTVTEAQDLATTAADALTMSTGSVGGSMRGTTTSANALKIAEDAVKTAQEELTTAADELADAENDVNDAQTEAEASADALKTAEDELKTAEENATTSAENLETAVDDLKIAQDNAKEAADNLKQAQDDLKEALDKSKTAAEELQAAIDALQDKTITITTIYVTRREGGGGGGDPGGATGSQGPGGGGAYGGGSSGSSGGSTPLPGGRKAKGGVFPARPGQGYETIVAEGRVPEVVAPLDALPGLMANMNLIPPSDVLSGIVMNDAPRAIPSRDVQELVIHNHMEIAGHEFDDLTLDRRRSLIRQERWSG